MSRKYFRDHAALVLLVVATVAASAPRQGAPPFEILSVPARNFGTCLPLRGTDSSRRASHLVIKSVPPGSTREITVMTDPSDRGFTYSDRVLVMRGAGREVGTSVIAFGEHGAAVTGFLHETETSTAAIPLDAAGLRALRDSAKSNVSRRALTVIEQEKLSEVMTFLRERCPP